MPIPPALPTTREGSGHAGSQGDDAGGIADPNRRDLLRLGWLLAFLLACVGSAVALVRSLLGLFPSVARLPIPSDVLARATTEAVIWEGLLLRVEGGALVVSSLRCTHLGCRVRAEGDAFVCPCHGSRFDRNGALLHGPAVTALRRLQVREVGASPVVLVGPGDV
jgi:Rieske Fe-S protein